jgi:hypothetical protein
MSAPDEELTFEEYWERYSIPTDTPKQAARNAWLISVKQERRLRLLNPMNHIKRLIIECEKCGSVLFDEINVNFPNTKLLIKAEPCKNCAGTVLNKE